MLEDEIQRAVQRTGAQMPIVWSMPDCMNIRTGCARSCSGRLLLLEQDYDTILLGFCLCGNALHGVRAAGRG